MQAKEECHSEQAQRVEESLTTSEGRKKSSIRRFELLFRNLSRRSGHCCRFNPLLASVDSFASFSPAANDPLGHLSARSPLHCLWQWRNRSSESTVIQKSKPGTTVKVIPGFDVEHRRFELLTPTLPVLCATNCANAPNSGYIITSFPLCKALFSRTETNLQSGGSVRLFSVSPSRIRRAATTSRSVSLPSHVTRIRNCSSGCTSSILV